MIMAIKVFDLSCEHDHLFEGWFSSQESYDEQINKGQIRCPVCSSDQITKRVSAPHLNIGNLRSGAKEKRRSNVDEQTQTAVAAPSNKQMVQLQAEVMRHVRKIVNRAEDVGDQFADEARRMHTGEVEERPIRGTASIQECRELAEDGIAIMPIPEILDDDRLQ